MTTIIPVEETLERVQREAYRYFELHLNTTNGLVRDKSASPWPASIAVTGLALAAYPVAIARGYLSREAAAKQTLATLRFLWNLPQGTHAAAAGYKGFFYHFLDMESGLRDGRCEISTIDTAFLIAGALAARQFFDGPEEVDIRTAADQLYHRVDWHWALNRGPLLTHGWRPRRGFIKYRWQGYNEALLLYILALASPTAPIDPASYRAWCNSYEWMTHHGEEYLYSGPLFTHQLSHCWIDFRGIQDRFMRDHALDYFENSRRATYAHYRYALENPQAFRDYGPHGWGLNASDGPGPRTLSIDGRKRRFYGYKARGAPYGPDDGTLSPWAVAASLPFAPELVLPLIEHQLCHRPHGVNRSYNPTFRTSAHDLQGWISPYTYGLDLGPIVLMIENHRSELLWGLMKQCSYIRRGLELAGFRGGWLE